MASKDALLAASTISEAMSSYAWVVTWAEAPAPAQMTGVTLCPCARTKWMKPLAGRFTFEQSEHRFAAHEAREVLPADEAVVAGHGGGEGVGLMLETGDEDVHGVLSEEGHGGGCAAGHCGVSWMERAIFLNLSVSAA